MLASSPIASRLAERTKSPSLDPPPLLKRLTAAGGEFSRKTEGGVIGKTQAGSHDDMDRRSMNASPTITAAATVLILFSVAMLLTIELLRRRSERLRGFGNT